MVENITTDLACQKYNGRRYSIVFPVYFDVREQNIKLKKKTVGSVTAALRFPFMIKKKLNAYDPEIRLRTIFLY